MPKEQRKRVRKERGNPASPLLIHLPTSASTLIQSTGHGDEYQTVTHSWPHTHSLVISQHNNMPLSVLFTHMH